MVIKPILTEKATQLAQQKVYMFQVHKFANKYQIRQVLEKLYPVKVKEVAVAIRKGKIRRVGRKMSPRKLPDKKIAYITLKEGKLDIFPQA